MSRLSRRAVLRGSALAGASVILPSPAEAAREPRAIRTISILHTTDLHGHIRPTQSYRGIANVGGLARCSSQIRRWKKESPHSLLLDIGDIYQGTAVGWMTRGRLMVDLFNQLNYDGWVLGNHEFDWGPEVVLDAVTRSTMPILTGNMKLEGKLAGTFEDSSHPLAKIVPHIVKNVGGFRIGVIGLTTPGLPYWLRPELLNGFEVTDPVEVLKTGLKYLREEAKVDAVVVCGHMGLHEEDDFANRVHALLESEEGPDVYLGGHTHRDQPNLILNKTLYTQADYYGIHCGRVDLSFDLEKRSIVEKRAYTVLMDDRIPEDPLVLEIAGKDLGDARSYLAEEMGELAVELSQKQPVVGMGSPLQSLIASSVIYAAEKHDLKPDGVFHGTFNTGTLPAGKKTIASAWTVLPYDNRLVALYLTREELVAVLNESLAGNTDRALFGFELELSSSEAAKGDSRGSRFVRGLTALRNPGPKPAGYRYCIVFNSYDVQSGGKRLMRLRALAKQGECKATLLPPSSRQALIDFFADFRVVRAADLSPGLPEDAPAPAPAIPKEPAPQP
jgi:2',3'-cyclic-nucleotide 2'-phosphodiesterase/3'-nucleotidase